MDDNLCSNKQLCNSFYSRSSYNLLSEVKTIDCSERDATHPLLRADQHPIKYMLCLSCNRPIQNNSFSDVCAHYLLYPHLQGLAKCLYCSENVYYYLYPGKVCPEIFHYCSPRKQAKEINSIFKNRKHGRHWR